MGTDNPAQGGEQKPIIKNEGNNVPNASNRRNNARRFIKKEQFQGAHPDLAGYVFETSSNRTNQIANFTAVDTRIRALVGQQFDPYVLESIEKMRVITPPEPTIVTEADGTVLKMEEIKYGKKYDWWLTRTEKVEKEMKQVYSVYYGQCTRT
jgi:hypothetical protein